MTKQDKALDVRHYLTSMYDELLARDGSAELTLEGAKQALRDVYLISCGEKPEHHKERLIAGWN